MYSEKFIIETLLRSRRVKKRQSMHQSRVLAEILKRSPYDLTLCAICAEMIIALPGGLSVCNDCISNLGGNHA